MKYRGYQITEKRDFGPHGFLIDGVRIREGLVVTDGACNVMPGGTWFRDTESAKRAVDVLEDEFGGPPRIDFKENPHYDNERFWSLVQQ